MSFAGPDLPAAMTVPRVVWRSAIGVAVVLLVLQCLTVGSPVFNRSPAVVPAQARLHVDPNVAMREELMLLPRIGPALADAIIAYRESVRPGRAFLCAEDLDHVPRIGPATVAKLRPLLRFPSDGAKYVEAEVRVP